VATEMQEFKYIQFLAIDGANNELPKAFTHQGFPEIFFISKKNKVEVYPGKRQFHPLYLWILKQIQKERR